MNKNMIIDTTEVKTQNELPYDELFKIIKKCYDVGTIEREDLRLIERQIYSAENILKNGLHAKEFRIHLLEWNMNPKIDNSCESGTRRLLADQDNIGKPIIRETLYTIISMDGKRQRYELYLDLPKAYWD